MADEPETPEEVLRGFWTEMHLWEWDAYRTMPGPSTAPVEVSRRHRERAGAEMAPIFEKYCTPKRRIYGQGIDRSIGSPPEYDPDATAIVDVTYESLVRVVVKTERRTGRHAKHIFVLLKRGGRWLIDNRFFYDGDGKIVRIHL
ncbi:MAG: hypothetical protein JO250_10780 [Armatimonadetes bacterium]|nr:hypothetical protein [Armatimonadota bacterium]